MGIASKDSPGEAHALKFIGNSVAAPSTQSEPANIAIWRAKSYGNSKPGSVKLSESLASAISKQA